MQITAAVLRAKAGAFKVEHITLDSPRADELLVRIVGAGVCHTDVSIQNAPLALPIVLGHEGAGIVEQVGKDVKKVKPGDHVVLTFLSCGYCATCQQGRPAYCKRSVSLNMIGTRRDGSTSLSNAEGKIHGNFFGQSSFATYALASERNTVKVRKDAPLELLGPLGCGIQTGAGAVANSLQVRAGSSIAVFGLGSVGLSAIMMAKVAGCTTIVGIDINPQRLALAQELGATHTIHSSENNAPQAIRKITRFGVDYALECSGLPDVFRQAVDCLHQLGVCGLVGYAPLGTEVTLDMNSILFGRTVQGILEGDSIPDQFIPQLIDLYMQGRFPFDRLVTHYDLNDINTATSDMLAGTTLKPILKFN